jgi:hypothetical protein
MKTRTKFIAPLISLVILFVIWLDFCFSFKWTNQAQLIRVKESWSRISFDRLVVTSISLSCCTDRLWMWSTTIETLPAESSCCFYLIYPMDVCWLKRKYDQNHLMRIPVISLNCDQWQHMFSRTDETTEFDRIESDEFRWMTSISNSAPSVE